MCVYENNSIYCIMPGMIITMYLLPEPYYLRINVYDDTRAEPRLSRLAGRQVSKQTGAGPLHFTLINK